MYIIGTKVKLWLAELFTCMKKMAEVVKIQEDLSREQIKGLFLAFRLENMSQVEKTFGYVIEEAVTKTKHEKT